MADFDALWNYSDAKSTEQKFLDVLAKTDLAGDATYLGQLYTQLARTQSLQNKIDEAHVYLDKAKALLAKADKVTEVRYLLELGRTELSMTYSKSDDNQRAYEIFEQAWQLAKGIQADGYAVDAGHMLAIAADTPKATHEWNLKSLAYAEQSPQPEAQYWKGSLYNNIGWTYFEEGKHQTALDMFEKALVEREKQQSVANIRIAKWCIARTQRELGQVDTALKAQLALLAEYDALEQTDEYVYEELAHCYKLMGDMDNASRHAKLAYDVFAKQDFMVKSEPDRLQALQEMME